MIALTAEVDRIGHVPKADELRSIRDMLYILKSKNGTMTKENLLSEINKILIASKFAQWARPTFEEYVLLMSYLNLAEIQDHHLKLGYRSIRFLEENKGTFQSPLSEAEIVFFRDQLLEYKTLLRFLEVVFCEGKDYDRNVWRIVEESHPIKGRREVLGKWVHYFGIDDDRDARALLTWCQQTRIVERDFYSDIYYLVSQTNPSYEVFLRALISSYREVFDREIQRATVPELRIRTCVSLHIPLSYFDNMLEVVEQRNPMGISMDRATSAREEVERYGFRRKGFYYYYVKLKEDDLQ